MTQELETLWQVFKDTTWSTMSVSNDTIQPETKGNK